MHVCRQHILKIFYLRGGDSFSDCEKPSLYILDEGFIKGLDPKW